jgi:hypothetical protein
MHFSITDQLSAPHPAHQRNGEVVLGPISPIPALQPGNHVILLPLLRECASATLASCALG